MPSADPDPAEPGQTGERGQLVKGVKGVSVPQAADERARDPFTPGLGCQSVSGQCGGALGVARGTARVATAGEVRAGRRQCECCRPVRVSLSVGNGCRRYPCVVTGAQRSAGRCQHGSDRHHERNQVHGAILSPCRTKPGVFGARSIVGPGVASGGRRGSGPVFWGCRQHRELWAGALWHLGKPVSQLLPALRAQLAGIVRALPESVPHDVKRGDVPIGVEDSASVTCH